MLYIEINLNKLKNNIDKITGQTGKKIIPVIKNDAYGLGAANVAAFLSSLNIGLMAVVNIEEALSLINNKVPAEFIVLNNISSENYHIVDSLGNIIITINSVREAFILSAYPFTRKIKIHFNIDTGMNRSGFKSIDEFREAYQIISANPCFIAEGAYTHFTDIEHYRIQENTFREYLDGHKFKIIHCSASSTYHVSSFGNHVRIGLDMFGDGLANEQIIKIATQPLMIRKVKKGETVGYNRFYRAETDELIAILPIGYGNGFRRALAGFPVLVNGKTYPTVGLVCMNHLFVKVDDSVGVDDEFIITSPDLPVCEMAEYLGTVAHEIYCMFHIPDKRYIGLMS